MGVKVTGHKPLAAKIRHAGERASANGRKTMHRKADQAVEIARLMAPVDKHNLEDSIQKVVAYGPRGRLQINIEAGGVVRGVNVTKYAVIVHENYEKMGPKTEKKQAANPQIRIGRKFLERALKMIEKDLNDAVLKSVLEVWNLK